MLIKVIRSQKTSIGFLRAGVVYDLDEQNPFHEPVIKRLIDKKFAEKLTKAQFDKLKKEAKKLAANEIVAQGDQGEAVKKLLIKSEALQESLDAIAAAAGSLTEALADLTTATEASDKEQDDKKRTKLLEMVSKKRAIADAAINALIEAAHQ